MIKKFVILILLIQIKLFAQQNNILFIKFNDESKIKITEFKDKEITIEVFDINLSAGNATTSFSISDKGNIIKRINVTDNDNSYLKFKYENVSYNNNPILISDYSIKNYITIEEIMSTNDFKNLMQILNSFEQIYIINTSNVIDTYYVGKKVKLEPTKSKL